MQNQASKASASWKAAAKGAHLWLLQVRGCAEEMGCCSQAAVRSASAGFELGSCSSASGRGSAPWRGSGCRSVRGSWTG